jgi:hypothetical protein
MEVVGQFSTMMLDVDWVQTVSVVGSFAFMWLGVFMLIKRAMRRRQPVAVVAKAPLLTNSEGETIAAIAAQLAAVNAQRNEESQRQENREERLAAVQQLFQGAAKSELDSDHLFGLPPTTNDLAEGEWADDLITEPVAVSPVLAAKKSRRKYLPKMPLPSKRASSSTSSVRLLAAT